MSTCGEVGSDVHALIKELAIRRVEPRSEIHSNESQHPAKGTEVARLWLQTGGGTCEHPTAPFARSGVCTSASYRGVTGSEGQEGANRVGGGWDGAEAGTGTGVEVNEGAQDGNGDGSGDGAGTGTGVETRRRTSDENGDGNGDGSEDSSGDGNGDEDNGNRDEHRIGESGREAKRRKKPKNSCRPQVGNGGDLGGKRKKCRKERVGPVAANPDSLESNKEAEGGGQGTQGSSKNCTSGENVSPLSRLISLGRINASGIELLG